MYSPEVQCDKLLIYILIDRARKLLSVRLFDDEAGKRWQKSVKDLQLELLCVSQFTLYHRLSGNKPDFHLAMQGPDAVNLYNLLLKQLSNTHGADRIKGESSGYVTFVAWCFTYLFDCRWKIRSIHASAHPE